MPLIARLVALFFLTNLVFCSLKSQIVIPLGTIADISGVTIVPKKLFKSYKFDTATTIIGIDLTDSTSGRAGKFSFIIDNAQDLAEVKKKWVLYNGIGAKVDRELFQVILTRHKLVESSWILFPKMESLSTKDGLFKFDTSILIELHKKSPLVHSTRTDSIKSKSDYLSFYDSVSAKPSFLFLIEPDIVCDGSFEVTLKADSHILPEEVSERIINSCNRTKPATAFKVYVKPNDRTANRKTYIVKGDQSLFTQFSNSEMEKANWKPETYVIKSYWRSL
jgi:hypothetical protein